MMRVMSSVGNPTDVSTITIVTSPACGMPAAPMLAAVAVILEIDGYREKHKFVNINCINYMECNNKIRIMAADVQHCFLSQE